MSRRSLVEVSFNRCNGTGESYTFRTATGRYVAQLDRNGNRARLLIDVKKTNLSSGVAAEISQDIERVRAFLEGKGVVSLVFGPASENH